ncbi:putative serine protease K12H4.7 isoform X2 [Lineus longissimus]
MIGGEGTANANWMVAGQWLRNAKKYNAYCLMLEHRYYGESHPTSSMTTENLRYLSSEQALADLANFRNKMAVKLGFENNKWIAFGGSYPGTLAAWFRMKYPHLVAGSVATSAPVFALVNFKTYLSVVRDSLNTFSSTCNPQIKKANEAITSLLADASGREKLAKMFMTCDPIDPTNENDMANFYNLLSLNFQNVVQYNKDNRAFEGAVDTQLTIDLLCKMMNDDNIGDTLGRYAAVNALVLKTYGTKCLDFKYTNYIKNMQVTDWTSKEGVGGRQWMYQSCVEFGFFQSSDLKDQPFGQHFPIKFFTQQCADIFGPKFTLELLQRGINETNTNYGGYHMKVTKVVFPNGAIDPWHALGITKDLNPTATALYIQGTAHCANMYPDSPDDPPQLKQARQKIEDLVGQWIAAK